MIPKTRQGRQVHVMKIFTPFNNELSIFTSSSSHHTVKNPVIIALCQKQHNWVSKWMQASWSHLRDHILLKSGMVCHNSLARKCSVLCWQSLWIWVVKRYILNVKHSFSWEVNGTKVLAKDRCDVALRWWSVSCCNVVKWLVCNYLCFIYSILDKAVIIRDFISDNKVDVEKL